MTTQEKMIPNKPIALIGFRGSGKTSVARAVADLLGGGVIDTDDLVTARAGKSIADVFMDEGESVFRRFESEAIAGTVENPPTVISVGGGAVLDSANVRALREVCFVVWLTAPAEVLWQRIAADPASEVSRPSLTSDNGLDEVRAVLAERKDLYRSAAHATIDTEGSPITDIAREIITLATSDA